MSSTGEGTIEIPFEDYCQFVMKYAPGGLDGAEVLVGPPKVIDDAVLVEFAWGTDGHPGDWAKPSRAQREMAAERQRIKKMYIDKIADRDG